MSLATRCTACGTVFRVVQDQLKVSEGWVRCGKCQAVFSAMDGLFDLDLKAAAALPAGNGSGFAPSPAVATPADHAPSGIVAPDRSGNTLFEQPFFAPPVQGASVWRGKRSAGERTRLGSRAEGLGPLSLPEQPPAPPQDRFGARADADLFDDDTADSAGALQIQPIDEEDAPFVLRRPAIEARAFEAPPSSRDLPGADALRRATAERDAQTETMPATFDRANAEDWRPSESGPPLADIAAARGLHIDLLIDDADATAGAATAVPAGPHARQAASSTPPRPVVSPDSHVLGGTLTDGSLEQDIADTADPPPAFLRDAERRSQRDTPRQRRVLIGVAVAMAALFCLQLVFHSRDVLAARFPAMSSPLAAMCAVAGCTLGPPRRIDDVVVDSSALTRVEGMDAFQLTVVLHNRSSMLLAMPSIDLSLTDTDGQLVSRRALQPADFASSTAALPAAGEQTLKLLLSAGERRVTGYTVELFYP